MTEDYAHYCAIYKDPATNQVTAVHQKHDGVSYEGLDRSDNLIQFQMLKASDHSVIFSVPLKPGQGSQLIWRRRIEQDPGGNINIYYLVGKKGAFVACLLPDYTMIIDNNFNEENSILSSVMPVKGEEGYEEPKEETEDQIS